MGSVGSNCSIRLTGVGRALSGFPTDASKIFLDRFGRTPQQWLNEQRLRDAPDLLLTVEHVKPVAYELGFNHPSHFIREFKCVYGYTPLKFVGLAFAETDQADQHRFKMRLSMRRKVGQASCLPGGRVSASRMRTLPSASPPGQAGSLPYVEPVPVHRPNATAKAKGGRVNKDLTQRGGIVESRGGAQIASL